MKKIKLGIYLHFKGGKYEILGLGKHSETMEDLVICRCLYKNSLSEWWLRPLKMFKEKVKVDGKLVPRFKFLKEK